MEHFLENSFKRATDLLLADPDFENDPNVTFYMPSALINRTEVERVLRLNIEDVELCEEIIELIHALEVKWVDQNSALGKFDVSVCSINGKRYAECSECGAFHRTNEGFSIDFSFKNWSGSAHKSLCPKCQEKYKDTLEKLTGLKEVHYVEKFPWEEDDDEEYGE